MPKSEGVDRGFAQRLSPLIAAAGVVPVPALLVRHQARLQLSNSEVIYLLHVLSHRWDGTHWPWVAVSAIAEGAGAHTGVVRRWKVSLEAKGYLVCKPRVVPGVGRRADEHDLSRLFAALEALALEEETQKALDKVRGDLPDAQYHRGLATTPQLSTGRPVFASRTRSGFLTTTQVRRPVYATATRAGLEERPSPTLAPQPPDSSVRLPGGVRST